MQQCTCTYVSDQCELDNLCIQMGSSKEACIRASECTLRQHVFPCFKPNKSFADAYSWLRIHHRTCCVECIPSHEQASACALFLSYSMILSLHDLCLFGKKKNRDLMDLDNAGVFVPLQKLPVLLFKRLISAVVKVLS